jgi:ABC-type Mn2+/Zn2+ transport system ATPase subunit
MSSTVVEARDLVVGYGGRALLPPVSVRIAREELWALVGINGGGKTTLLRTMLGLLPRVRGEVVWHGGARVGYVPQRTELDLSVPRRVRDVVSDGLDHEWSFLRPGIAARGKSRVESVLAETGMSALMNAQFLELSDGQRQRVLVARALVSDPELLVLDEPTNGMDVAAERTAFELFATLRSTRKLALVIVSHHMAMLGARASHVLWVDKDEGQVVSGDVESVRADARFIAHYGTVFGPDAGSVARSIESEAAR